MLRRRLVSLFLAMAIALSVVVVSSCKKEEPAPPTQKQVQEKAAETQKAAEKAVQDVQK